MQVEQQVEQITGFLIIDKPVGPTSFDCIRKLKKILKGRIKIGHSGTLDDFAGGLLIICIGRQATRLVNMLMNVTKEYVVRAKLGELTDSLDRTGKVIKTVDASSVVTTDLEQAIKQLGSSYEQVPPIYSALKYEGRPLYKLARYDLMDMEKLEEIQATKKRIVSIYEMELVDFNPPHFTIRAHVSKGTYVRSLANDLAQKLDLHATTYDLTRTKIGSISLADSVLLEQLETIADIQNHLLSLDELTMKLGIINELE